MSDTDRFIEEPRRKIPVAREVDVAVCGGGPAGLIAAIAAAKNGARTIILERYGFLGGMATAGLVRVLARFFIEGRQIVKGIPWEMIERMAKLGGAVAKYEPKIFGTVPFDSEVFKLVANEMVVESGAEILFHTLVTDVLKDGNKIRGLIVENKSGRQAILSKVVVDATGDGDMAFHSGAPFEKGRPGDGFMQPMTMVFRLGVTSREDFQKIWALPRDKGKTIVPLRDKMKEAQEKGELPVFGGPWIWPIETQNKLYVNAVRYWGDATDAEELTKAEISGRRDAWAIYNFFRENFPELASCCFSETGTQIGLRETRRITGEYVLKQDDLINNTPFSDSIAFGGHPIDIHSPDGTSGQTLFWPDAPYQIPYRCLVPLKVENLITAGRCISTTHEAHASVRVMGTAMAIGQAAGTAAAITARDDMAPRKADVKKLQGILEDQGALF